MSSVRYMLNEKEINTLQWTGDNENELIEFVGEKLLTWLMGNIAVLTNIGEVQLYEGYYVVKNSHNDVYVFDEDFFNKYFTVF